MKNLYLLPLSWLLFTFLFTACDSSEDISEPIQMGKAEALKVLETKNAPETCTNIQSGTLLDLNGQIITLGFNDEGYNYQAKMYYGEYFPDEAPGWFLEWKWNDAYLSNRDCDGDLLLDIANGQDGYIGTGAWTTTKWTTDYTDQEGNTCRISQFTKYVAVPIGAYAEDGTYYEADGTVIGATVNPDAEGFEDFAIVQFVWNDPCGGKNGVEFKAPGPIGLGNR